MKIIALLAFLLSFTAQATNSFGLYMFEMNFDWSGQEKVVFLMNSSAEIKELEDEYYYSIDSIQFFNEVTLNFQSGGDEDYVIARAILGEQNGKTVMLNFCAAIIDGPNGQAGTIGPKTAKLSKWNKKTKRFNALKLVASQREIEACENDLLKEYVQRGYDISEY